MMDFLYAEINIIGIVLLWLFLNNMNRNKHRKVPLDQAIFNAVMIMNIVIFILDMGMWMADSKDSVVLTFVNQTVTMLYYVSNPLICLVWLLYTDYKINESKNGLIRRFRYYVIPFLINAVLSVMSLFTGWLYTIDANNTYARGPYFWVMALAALIYLLYSFGLAVKDVLKHGWKTNTNVNIHLVIFPIGIIVASVLQILFFGLSIIWVCTMIAIASIYINIQNTETSTDHLTGLYNRRRLDEHFIRKSKVRKADQVLFAIMIDLDDFKKINDQFGHATGDEALIVMSELLREACKGNEDFITRMGGDEFVILGERPNTEEVEKLMKRIDDLALAVHDQRQLVYALKPSMGYSIYKSTDTINTFFASADKAMYQNKLSRKETQ